MSNRDLHFIRMRGSTIADPCRINGFLRARNVLKIAAGETALFPERYSAR
jgi:hypothetical protein